MGTDRAGAHRFHPLREPRWRRESAKGRSTWESWCAAPAWAWHLRPAGTRKYAPCPLSDCYSAKMARQHNDANILCLGGRVLGQDLAVEVLRTWLATEFLGGKYAERLQMMRGGYKGTSK